VGAHRVDQDTAKAVASVARLLRRAAALVRVRADKEGAPASAAVLINFALLRTVTSEPGLHPSLHIHRARLLIITVNSATEMVFTPRRRGIEDHAHNRSGERKAAGEIWQQTNDTPSLTSPVVTALQLNRALSTVSRRAARRRECARYRRSSLASIRPTD
jgi:uncharacterized DUF497 family protein